MPKQRVQVEPLRGSVDLRPTASPVDTFVRPEQNTRGKQIASALESVAGVATNFARQQQEEVRLIDGLNAQNEVLLSKRGRDDFLSRYNYNPQTTTDAQGNETTAVPDAQQAFTEWYENNESLTASRDKLVTKRAKAAFDADLRQGFITEFDKQAEIAETGREDATLTSSIMADKDPAIVDQEAQALGRTPKESYETMFNIATRLVNDPNQDEKVIAQGQGVLTWLASQNIGGSEFQSTVAKTARAVEEQSVARKERELRLAKAQRERFRTETLANLDIALAEQRQGGEAVELDDYVAQLSEAGVPNARKLVDTVADSYKPEADDLNAEQTVRLNTQFEALSTQQERWAWLEQKRKPPLPHAVLQNFITRTNTAGIDGDVDKVLKSRSYTTIADAAMDATENIGVDLAALMSRFNIEFHKVYLSDAYQQARNSNDLGTMQRLAEGAYGRARAGMGLGGAPQAADPQPERTVIDTKEVSDFLKAEAFLMSKNTDESRAKLAALYEMFNKTHGRLPDAADRQAWLAGGG